MYNDAIIQRIKIEVNKKYKEVAECRIKEWLYMRL